MATLWRNTMKTLFTTIEYENIIFAVEFIYKPLVPGRFSGPPENCYPDEPAELEFLSVSLPGSSINLLDALSESAIESLESDILLDMEAESFIDNMVQ